MCECERYASKNVSKTDMSLRKISIFIYCLKGVSNFKNQPLRHIEHTRASKNHHEMHDRKSSIEARTFSDCGTRRVVIIV